MNERDDVVFIQRGSSSTLRVQNGNCWNVVREEWQGSRLLNSAILSSHNSFAAAKAAKEKEK